MTTKSDRVLVDVTIAAPIESVWKALRDPDQIRNWFGWDAETLADEIDFIFIQHAQDDLSAGRLQFGDWEGSSDRFEVTQTAHGTRLKVIRHGPVVAGWEGIYEEMTEGWRSFVQQLRLALERHSGHRRRTIYLSGGGTAAMPRALLGLPGGDTPGAPFAGLLPTGDRIEGVLWHTSPYQTGLLVPAWGQGLLVVMDRPATPDRAGGGSATLTTYGLSDVELAGLAERWRDWWQRHYPEQMQNLCG